MINFGHLVKQRRKAMAYSQTDVANLAGLTRGTVNHIENGSQRVFLHQAVKLARVLKSDLDKLKDGHV